MRTRVVTPMIMAAILTGAAVGALSAQPTKPSVRWSVEAGLGGSRDRGGDPWAVRENFGVADLGVTLGVRERSTGTVLAGLNFATYLNNGSNLRCPIRQGVPGCIPDHPEFSSVSLLAGWQTPRPERGSLRVLAGPGVYRAGNRDFTSALGWLARVDVASPSLLRVSLVGSIRASVVPNAEGTRYRQTVLGLGVRLH